MAQLGKLGLIRAWLARAEIGINKSLEILHLSITTVAVFGLPVVAEFCILGQTNSFEDFLKKIEIWFLKGHLRFQ